MTQNIAHKQISGQLVAGETDAGRDIGLQVDLPPHPVRGRLRALGLESGRR
jgi:hypothetical protein